MFDGNNKTISGLNLINGDRGGVGLIAEFTAGVTVKNLNIVNSKAISTDAYVGMVLGKKIGNNATVENVSVKNCEVSGLKSVAAISGHNEDNVTVTVKNCTVENCEIEATEKRGGIFVGCYTSQVTLVAEGNESKYNTLTVAGNTDNTEYCEY